MKPPVMRPALRWALGLVALLTAAVAWLPEEDAQVLRPSTVARAAPTQAASAPGTPRPTGEAQALPGAEAPWPAPTAAALAAWRAAPRAAPARAAPPPPAPPAGPAPPPPLPYQWIGQIEEDGRPRFFLADAQNLWPVSPGEALATGWRVDGLQEGQLQFTWLATGATAFLQARP